MPAPSQGSSSFGDSLQKVRSQRGDTLDALSQVRPLLVVFLRHAGCTFCREALADLRQQRAALEQRGLGIALVHMSTEEAGRTFFAKYQLDDLPRFSDPQQQLYRAFELSRGSWWQLLGPLVWWRGAKAFFAGHGIGWLQGDGFQMPGAFVLHRGRVVQAYRHRFASDRPHYLGLAESCTLE